MLTVLLLAAAVAGAAIHGSGWWLLAAFAIGPDIALLLGISSISSRGGCIHAPFASTTRRTATGARRCWRPAPSPSPSGCLIGALAWAFHISLDRAVGYGMRTRDGFQRS